MNKQTIWCYSSLTFVDGYLYQHCKYDSKHLRNHYIDVVRMNCHISLFISYNYIYPCVGMEGREVGVDAA
jgi:hypothetical protein